MRGGGGCSNRQVENGRVEGGQTYKTKDRTSNHEIVSSIVFGELRS